MPTIPPSRIAPPPVQKQKRGASLPAWSLWLLFSGCAAGGVTAVSVPGVGSGSKLTVPDIPGVVAAGPAATRIDPHTEGNAPMPPGLAALRDELQRGMTELKAKGNDGKSWDALQTRMKAALTEFAKEFSAEASA